MTTKDHPFIVCECGARIKSNSVYTHLKSKKHIDGKPSQPKMKIIHGSVDVTFPGRCYISPDNHNHSSDAKNVS